MPRVLAATLLSAMLAASCASSMPSPSPSRTAVLVSAGPSQASSSGATPESTTSPFPPTPTKSPRPASSPVALLRATLPVKGSGRDLGTAIQMAPGPDGRLWLSIPGNGGDVVALLDKTGKPSPGWPILLPGVYGCDLLLPVADGYVRVVCTIDVPPTDSLDAPAGTRAFAFDANARSLPGWPVDVETALASRMVGDDLTMIVSPYLGDTPTEELVYMLDIRADGTVRQGVNVPFGCCEAAIGPDGVGYLSTHRDWSVSDPAIVKTDLVAFGMNGPRAGWPVTIDGNGSDLAFDAPGRVYVIVGAPGRPARMMVIDRDGKTISNGSRSPTIVSSNPSRPNGEPGYPGAPIVATDGTAFSVSTEGGRTTVFALDPAGKPLDGWPYQSNVGIEWTGYCGEGDTGCGYQRTDPGVGSQNLLYLLQAASSSSAGGRMVAIAADGQLRDGWPVRLKRAGSMFWSMAVAPDGGLWALAIEPETQGYSATIVAITDDGAVIYTTTIVEP